MYIVGIGGAMIIAVISFIATGLILLKVYWGKVVGWFKRNGDRTEGASETRQDK